MRYLRGSRKVLHFSAFAFVTSLLFVVGDVAPSVLPVLLRRMIFQSQKKKCPDLEESSDCAILPCLAGAWRAFPGTIWAVGV